MYYLVSRFFCLLLLIVISSGSYAYDRLDDSYIPKEKRIGKLIVIGGCAGEYCSEFCDKTKAVKLGYGDEYWVKEFSKAGKPSPSKAPIGLKTARTFTLYSDLQEPSPIARYGPGFVVKPIEQQIVIRDRGEYAIDEVKRVDHPLKVGDKVDTPIYAGEGSIMVRNDSRWIWFKGPDDSDNCFRAGDCNELKLKVIREAKVELWLKVEVNGVVGFTPDDGLLPCLDMHFGS